MHGPALPFIRVACALSALAAVACGASERAPLPFPQAGPSVAPDPSVAGPFPVGVTTLVLEDRSRPKPDGSPRRLVTEVWYPATEDARAALEANPAAGAFYDVLDLLTPELLASIGDLRAPLLRTAAIRGAAPRAEWAPFPLVVFSHGQGGVRWQSTFYTVALASHGYVVVSPDHEGNTLAAALVDALSGAIGGFADRPVDVSFLLDRFLAKGAGGASAASLDVNLGGSPGAHEGERDRAVVGALGRLIDPARVGVTGHSFGAFTSLRVASKDPRVKAIVAQAPPDAVLSFIDLPNDYALPTPAMILGGGLDRTLPYANAVSAFERLGGPRILVDVKTGGHFTFSDLCGFNLSALADRVGFANLVSTLSDGCLPPAPPASLAKALIDYFSIGFFNATLKDSEPSWLLFSQARADQFWPGVANVTTDF